MANQVSLLQGDPTILYGPAQSNGEGDEDDAGDAALASPYKDPIPFSKVFYKTDNSATNNGTIATLQAFVNNNWRQGSTVGIGPEVPCAYVLGQAKQKEYYHIKYAIGGSSIGGWLNPSGGNWDINNPASNYYIWRDRFILPGLAARTASGKNPYIKALIFDQGEASMTDSTAAANYETDLMQLFNKIKDDLRGQYPSIDSALFIILRTHNNFLNIETTRPFWNEVRTGQVNVANSNPNYRWIDTDPFPLNADKIHRGHAGQILAGTAAANIIKQH
jgi:hypothetical protein